MADSTITIELDLTEEEIERRTERLESGKNRFTDQVSVSEVHGDVEVYKHILKKQEIKKTRTIKRI